tara:strand:+ start:821 stop:1264 length:444 start_codon:yes stop_codon:yes gene_type:complete
MDYLLKKSDGSVTKLSGGTVSRLQLPDSSDTIFPGDTRPVDLGDYVLVKATEVTQEITSGKKRGDTTVVGDKSKETVTVTHTAVDQTDVEQWASIRAERDSKLMDSDWMANSDVTMSSAWKTYRQALRDLPASKSDPDDITWPTKPS